MAFNVFATATTSIPLANLDANFTLLGSAAAASTLYPTATTSITYGTTGTSHVFNGTTLTANTLNLTNALGTAYGGTGLTSFTANGVVYASSTSALATGSALTFDGTYFNANGLRISGSDSSNTLYKASGDFGITSNAGALTYQTTANQPQVFYVNSAEQMRLNSTGLGIGTSSPAVKLDVQGASNSSTNWTWAGGNVANPPAGCTYGVLLGRNLSNGLSEANIVWGQGISSNQFLGFGKWTGSAYTEQMRLDYSGNLGLGVTPSAWGNGTSIQGSAWSISTLAGFDQSGFYTNARQTAYGGSTSNWAYRGTAGAAGYAQTAGGHYWLNAPSGTAGNAITFTQAATLTANGNYLLGTTTEPSNRKSGNTYQAINSAVIEGTPYTTVSTSPVQLSRPSSVGLIAMISGYNTSGGAQGTWLVLVGNGVAVVVSSSDATATTPIFAVSAGALTMKTTTGTLSVVCQIFTVA